MAETLTVHVNREGIHSVTAPDAVESDGPLVVELHNHGEPCHVHLRLAGPLAEVGTLGATNHYVDTDRRSVPLDVGGIDDWPVTGQLEVVTGYGQESATVEITLTEPQPVEPAVSTGGAADPDAQSADGAGAASVDASSDPDTADETGSSIAVQRPSTNWGAVIPVLVLAVVAVGLAVLAVEVAGESVVVAAGVAVVAVAILVAGYLLYRG